MAILIKPLLLCTTVAISAASLSYLFTPKSGPEKQFVQVEQTKPKVNPSFTDGGNNQTLLAIQKSLDSLHKSIPELRKTIETNKTINDKQVRKLELALQDIAGQKDISITEPDNFLSPDEEYQVSIATAAAEVELFDSAIESEERDEIWASRMEDDISQTFTNAMYKGSTFSGLECKSTTCRFEAVHTDEESKDNFELIRRELPHSYHIQHFDNADGTSMSVMYLIKEGTEEDSVIFKTLSQS